MKTDQVLARIVAVATVVGLLVTLLPTSAKIPLTVVFLLAAVWAVWVDYAKRPAPAATGEVADSVSPRKDRGVWLVVAGVLVIIALFELIGHIFVFGTNTGSDSSPGRTHVSPKITHELTDGQGFTISLATDTVSWHPDGGTIQFNAVTTVISYSRSDVADTSFGACLDATHTWPGVNFDGLVTGQTYCARESGNAVSYVRIEDTTHLPDNPGSRLTITVWLVTKT